MDFNKIAFKKIKYSNFKVPKQLIISFFLKKEIQQTMNFQTNAFIVCLIRIYNFIFFVAKTCTKIINSKYRDVCMTVGVTGVRKWLLVLNVKLYYKILKAGSQIEGPSTSSNKKSTRGSLSGTVPEAWHGLVIPRG